ncbi:MAG: prepilin-type N-terminal cleavage/methylation domain-containing protein [Planctomycetota bacterium]|nr:prepilin-type N-terminal cleavage/methylation domain-containing protein [Planctomycetota bacterium]
MRRRGFTILEVLLALALASIVIVVCYTILVSTLKARAQSAEVCRWARIQGSVLDIMTEDLKQATRPMLIEDLEEQVQIDLGERKFPEEDGEGKRDVEVTEIDPETGEEISGEGSEPETDPYAGEKAPDEGMRGDPSRFPYLIAERMPDFSDGGGIAFVIANPGYDEDSGSYHLYREVSYFIRRDDRTSAYLLYRREQRGWDGELDEGGTTELLCDIIGDMQVEYYDGMDWLDEWELEERRELPIAIRIRISFYFEQTPEGLPDTTSKPKEFYTVVKMRNSRYIDPEDRDRLEREGIIQKQPAPVY